MLFFACAAGGPTIKTPPIAKAEHATMTLRRKVSISSPLIDGTKGTLE
jgi:hypothetical protein